MRSNPLRRITRCPLGLASHDGALSALHRRLDEGIEGVENLFGQTTIEQLVDGASAGQNPLCEAVAPAVVPLVPEAVVADGVDVSG